jgi:TRAP transporter 4TM/12TM fusion protein
MEKYVDFVTKALGVVIPIVAIIAVLNIPLYLTDTSLFDQQYLGLFWGLVATLIFLTNPASKKITTKGIRWYDLLAALLCFGLGIYVTIFYPKTLRLLGMPSLVHVMLGGLAVVLVLESVRRVAGLPIVIIIFVFILYTKLSHFAPSFLYNPPLSWSRLLSQLYLGGDFMLGTPLRVTVLIVFAYILFGEVLYKMGGGQFFIDIGLTTLGGFRGGPAKVSVLSSSLFGTISGSAVANVMVTGLFTIPLMKKTGYPAFFAGAVEATASNGGQIMPPVMGAAAFIMAEFLEIPYAQVAIAALVPALLYYFGLYTQLDLRAATLGLKGLPRSELPSLTNTIRKGWVFIIPLIVLVIGLFVLYLPPEVAALYATGTVTIITLLKKDTRAIWNLRMVLGLLQETTHAMMEITAIAAAVGFVVGIVGYTGLGLSFSRVLTEIAGGSLFLLAVFTAMASIILGMGMPTTAAYILLAVLAAPALVKVGVTPLLAHLFVLYFGTLSMLTPPVALAAYAAASIAGAPMMKVGYQSIRLAVAAYLVPFIWLSKPGVTLVGSMGEIIFSIFSSFVLIGAIAIAFEGHFLRKLSHFEKIVFAGAGIALIARSWYSQIFGLTLIILLVAVQIRDSRKRKLEVIREGIPSG